MFESLRYHRRHNNIYDVITRIITSLIVAGCLLASCSDKKRDAAVAPGNNGFFSSTDSTEEVQLPSVNGTGEVSVEQLQGSVVIMDVLYSTPPMGDSRMQTLRRIYDKYHDRGLEIYQVCMDTIPERWAQMAKTLPWVAVYDDNTLQSRLLAKYKVMTIPSMQLFNREGKRISKSVTIKTLEKTVEDELAK